VFLFAPTFVSFLVASSVVLDIQFLANDCCWSNCISVIEIWLCSEFWWGFGLAESIGTCLLHYSMPSQMLKFLFCAKLLPMD